jgi:hypothetical protein
MMIAGLWFGPENPRMDNLLKPFIDECCDSLRWRENSGILKRTKVFSLICSSDTIARPILLP